MRELQMLPGKVRKFDATPIVPVVAKRLHKVLDTTIFRVKEANFEGMEHLRDNPLQVDSKETAQRAAHELGI